MPYTENQLYNLHLPDFLIQFKNLCLNLIIPNLEKLQSFLNAPSLQNNHDPVVTLLTIIIVIQILKAIKDAFSTNSQENVNPLPSANTETNREILSLKKQVKSLQKIFKQYLIINSQSSRTIKSYEKDSDKYQIRQGQQKEQNFNQSSALKECRNSKLSRQNQLTSTIAIEMFEKMKNLYEQSWKRFENITSFILQSQENVVKLLKSIRKKAKNKEKSQNTQSLISQQDSKKQKKVNGKSINESTIKKSLEIKRQIANHSTNIKSQVIYQRTLTQSEVKHDKSSIQQHEASEFKENISNLPFENVSILDKKIEMIEHVNNLSNGIQNMFINQNQSAEINEVQDKINEKQSARLFEKQQVKIKLFKENIKPIESPPINTNKKVEDQQVKNTIDFNQEDELQNAQNVVKTNEDKMERSEPPIFIKPKLPTLNSNKNGNHVIKRPPPPPVRK